MPPVLRSLSDSSLASPKSPHSNILSASGRSNVGSTKKSLSSSFSCSPHWKHVRDLSQDEEKTLETTWDGRHSMHFSVCNGHLSVGMRDYFDRTRALPDDKTPGPKPEVRMRPVWSLNMEAIKPSERVDFSSNIQRSIRVPKDLPKRAQWDDRHSVTHSAQNTRAHEYHREYFSRYVDPRTSRMLEHRKNGIERHLMPAKHPTNPDGQDYAPPPDIFADDDVSLPRMARFKPMPSPVLAPARPDGSFDLWGGS